MADKQAGKDIPDRSHADPDDPRVTAKGIETEIEVTKTETIKTPDIPIRPEQTPRKREGLEERDSDQSRGDDLRPADIDNPIARQDIPDPLDTKGKK